MKNTKEWEAGIIPRDEIFELYKSGKMNVESYLIMYQEQLFSIEANNWIRKVANESKNKNILLVGSEKDPQRCHRKIITNMIKRYFPWADVRGEI